MFDAGRSTRKMTGRISEFRLRVETIGFRLVPGGAEQTKFGGLRKCEDQVTEPTQSRKSGETQEPEGPISVRGLLSFVMDEPFDNSRLTRREQIGQLGEISRSAECLIFSESRTHGPLLGSGRLAPVSAGGVAFLGVQTRRHALNRGACSAILAQAT